VKTTVPISITVNTRCRLNCSTFFLLARARQESRSSDEVLESLWPGRPRLWAHRG
jgi:hypothetical protein